MWSFLFSAIGFNTDAWAARPPGEFTSVSSDRSGGPGIPAEALREALAEVNINTFSLPEDLGTVRDAWSPKKYALAAPAPAETKKELPQLTVIHIQDAHCNYEGQRKISDIINYVNKEYGVKSVNLEGGVKNYDLSAFTSITEAEIRQRVSDYFVKNGRLNGAEYFAVNNPAKVNLWGIEDTQLYVANLGIYRESLKHKREVDKFLGTLGHILAALKVKIYNKDLIEFDAKYIQYKAGNLDFKDYISYLIAKAKDKGLKLEKFMSVYLLGQTLEEETKIDFKKANRERDELVENLKKKLSNNDLKELTAKTAEFKAGVLSQKNLYDYLAEKAKTVNVDMEAYPELGKYMDYISMYNGIDKMKAMGEIAELEIKIKDTMIENATQRRLDLLSKNLALLKNIFNISLSKDDYRYFLDNRASFDIANYVSFIEKEAPTHRIDTKLDEGIALIDAYRDDVAQFYEYSLKRDEAFLRNIKYEKAPGRDGADRWVAVMVTGGFHTENLAEHFRKNNIAYVSIMPNFRNNAGYKAPYMDLLAGRETDIEKAIDTALSSMQIYSYLTTLGIAVDGERAVNRFKLAVAILAVLERKDICVIVKETPSDTRVITFKAERDNKGNIVNVTFTEARYPKPYPGDWDINITNLENEPFKVNTPPTTPNAVAGFSPATQEYLAGLKAKGDVTSEIIETLKTAEEIYEAIKSAVPAMVDILKHDANTYIIAPAPLEDYAKTVDWANRLRRAMGENEQKVQAGYYKIGLNEDWLNGTNGLASELNKENMLPHFLDSALGQWRSQGKAVARLCVRVQSAEHKDALLEYLKTKTRIGSLTDAEKTAVLARIRVEIVEIGSIEHLNPVPDFFTDMLAMEFDRYSQNDYPKDTMPKTLPDRLGMMLQLTTENITADMIKKDGIEAIMNAIFGGEALKIKAINWKSIDEWKERNNAVVTAV